MARRNSGPAFNPPSPEPEDRIAMEGDIVCCLGECRQVVNLATSVLSQQYSEYLNQIAVLLARILEPIRATVLSQLQLAQDKADTVTVQLEDAALHHLMVTAAMIQSLQSGLTRTAGPLPAVPDTQPAAQAAASAGVAGGALSAAQVAGSLVSRPATTPVAADEAPTGPAPIGAAPLPLLAPGQLPPAPPGLYPLTTLAPPVTSATPEPPGGGQPGGAGQLAGDVAACGPQRPFPVDLPQLVPFLFSGDTDAWRQRALSWVGGGFADLVYYPSYLDWLAAKVMTDTVPSADPGDKATEMGEYYGAVTVEFPGGESGGGPG